MQPDLCSPVKASQPHLESAQLVDAAARPRLFNGSLLRSSLLAEIATLPYLRAEIDVHFICQSSVRRLSKVDSRWSIASGAEMKSLSDSFIKNKTKNKKSERRRLSSPLFVPHQAASSAKTSAQLDVGEGGAARIPK